MPKLPDAAEALQRFLKGNPAELPLSHLLRGYHRLAEAVREQQARLDHLRAVQATLEAHITGRMLQEDIQRLTVDGRTFYLLEQQLPVVEDWETLLGWIGQTGNLQLLQRRVSMTALRELQEAGIEPPAIRIERMLRLGHRKA